MAAAQLTSLPLTQLSFGDALFVVAFLGLVSVYGTLVDVILICFIQQSVHLVFKHFEPSSILVHCILLLVTPGFAIPLVVQHLDLWRAVPLTLAIFYTTLLSSVTVYRISPIHPLSAYPGPLHLKVSKLWLFWVACVGKQHAYVAELHKRYGDAVRIGMSRIVVITSCLTRSSGPNELSICDATVIEPLLGANEFPRGPSTSHFNIIIDGRTVSNCSKAYTGSLPDDSTPSLVALTDLKEHARRRKMWNRAFTPSALKDYEETMSKRTAELIEKLSSHTGVVDMSILITRFA